MALASTAEVQDSLYPDFVAKGDELVFDYDEALNKTDVQSKLNVIQEAALHDLETYLEMNAGKNYEEMYCDTDSLYNDPRWEKIRKLTNVFIESMGWSYEKPKKNNSIYLNKEGSTKNT